MDSWIITFLIIVLTILVSVITKNIIPYLAGKVNQQDLATIQFWVKTVLYATEQVYKTGRMSEDISKKQYALYLLRRFLPDIDDAELDVIIEGIGKAIGLFKEDKPNESKTPEEPNNLL